MNAADLAFLKSKDALPVDFSDKRREELANDSRVGKLLLLTMVFLVSGSPLSRADFFDLFKSKSNTKQAQAATAARLKEIDQATKNFADRYVTYLADACYKAEQNNPDPEARKYAVALTVVTSNSVYGIAASPNPLGQLLDLCVVVTLQKMNWVEEGRAKKIFGADRGAAVIQTFNNGYAEVWEMAGRFLTPAEIAEVKKLTRQWRANHKDITLLAYVRFDDFAKARAGVGQQNPVVHGLFAQIAEANRSIQTATDFGERALYYTERLPRLLQWQTERTVQAVLEDPDLHRSLASIEQLSKTVAQEVAKFDKRQAEIQKTLDQVNQITVNGRPLMIETRQAGEALTETAKAFDHLVHPPGVRNAKPFDITEYGSAFDKATVMVHEARLFVDSSLQLESAPVFKNRVADIEAFSERSVDHIALRVAELVVFFFATLILYRWLCARWFGRKRAGGNPAPTASAHDKPATGTRA